MTKILLIEDDKIDQIAFKRFVRAKGLEYDYTIAESVEEAKNYLAENKYDIVITDYLLGDGSAFDIFDSIIDTPFIFTTGEGDEEIAVSAMKAGAFYYYIKDQERNYLKFLPVTIQKALRNKQLEEERHHAELALKESEEKFRAITSAANDAIIMMNYLGDVSYWNTAAEKIFGFKNSEIMGRNLHSTIVPKNEIGLHLRSLEFFWKTGSEPALGRTEEMIVLHKDGHKFPVELSLSAVKIEKELNSIVIIRDITKRKKAEEALKSSRERLALILQSIGNGVVVIDSDQNISIINDKAKDLLGFSTKMNPLLLKTVLRNCKDEGSNLLENLELGTFTKLELKVEYPLPKILYATATTFNDVTGNFGGQILIFWDVTREREIDVMKTDFVSSVSHELRTPLTSIMGFSKTILKNPNMDSEDMDEFVGIIYKESKRLSDLIEDVLSISKIESGAIQYSFKQINLGDVINDVFNIYKLQAGEKGLKIDFKSEDTDLRVMADQHAIHQVAVNFVGNAIKFTEPGGTVSIEVKKHPYTEEILMEIKDSGMGIPKQDQPKIFQKFYRVSRPGTHIQGTGLGLSIVKGIVEAHSGSIELESEEGKGSLFRVVLPAVGADLS